ncbi:MAG: hypothetical protein II560_05275, partial [Bacteroidales bacterium]|nr:hypothetical protein [Bacteroidales bacterium]
AGIKRIYMSYLRYFAIVGIMVAFLAAIGYVGLRIYKILPFPTGWKIAAVTTYLAAIVALFLSFTGRLDPLPMNLATVLYILGNTWLIFFVYTFMAFALTDILRLFHVLSPSFLSESKTGSAVIFGLVAIILLYGRIHYQHKYRTLLTGASGLWGGRFRIGTRSEYVLLKIVP